ncbi:sigma 54-interacting transcriptional regulator [Alteribacillus sp. JSM 102045]|uniref:sigma 54-interacting transcriptional regulator n=1 Tax=Alteribacillus sp. JSM 102045 TaxID=1562101 RepID=UPI0035BF9BC5
MADIILTSPYNEMTKKAKELQKSLDLNMIIIESALDEALELVRKEIRNYPEAILISRGATADLLETAFPDSHLLRMDPTEYDVIRAFHQAKQKNKKIGYLGRVEEGNHFHISALADMLGIEVTACFYKDSAGFLQQISKADEEGIEVMIGGGMRGEVMCMDRGMEHISLISGRTTMYQVLSRAADIINTEMRERDQSTFIRTVVELSGEGVIAFNSKDVVTVMNPKASNLLHMNSDHVLHKNIHEIKMDTPISQLFFEKSEQKDHLIHIHDTTLMVNRVPYEVKNDKGLIITIQDVTHIQESEKRIRQELYQKGLAAKYHFSDIIHKDETMKRVIKRAERFAAVDGNVLILGESGTGKELLAQSIHNAHPKRNNSPFVAINCAAITDSLLESELFGYEKGAFTGASKEGKVGLFEMAHGGTVFLDEIGKMSLDLQSKILRVLQEREVRRIGGSRNIPVDVRVIAASNEDLKTMSEAGSFRTDLYYRLEVLVLRLPSLKERIEDVACLSTHMIKKYGHIYQKQTQPLSDFVLKKMQTFPWPGNLRQLENIIERALVIADHPVEIEEAILDSLFEESELLHEDDGKKYKNKERAEGNHLLIPIGKFEDMQISIIEKMMNEDMTKQEMAKELGISRTTLWKLMKKIT